MVTAIGNGVEELSGCFTEPIVHACTCSTFYQLTQTKNSTDFRHLANSLASCVLKMFEINPFAFCFGVKQLLQLTKTETPDSVYTSKLSKV